MVKHPPANAGVRDVGSIPRSERYLGVGNWQPTPVFLPGKFHGQRSLAGYNPWGQLRLSEHACTRNVWVPVLI